MASPFPGMDPYLEAGHLWHTVHTHLVVHICEDLQPQVLPHYVASSEERVLVGPLEEGLEPDVGIREPARRAGGGMATAVRTSDEEIAVPTRVFIPELSTPERFVTIRDTRSHEIITAIEILSPWNKGGGYEDYRAKQREYLHSRANLVEIDLLRAGRHTVAVPLERTTPADYRICIHRAGSPEFEVIPLRLRDPLPNFYVPLRRNDADVVLHLGRIFQRVFEGGGYLFKAEYGEPPDPPLSPEDAQWADTLLREHGLRP